MHFNSSILQFMVNYLQNDLQETRGPSLVVFLLQVEIYGYQKELDGWYAGIDENKMSWTD